MGSETGFRRTAAKTIRAVSALSFPFSFLKGEALKKVQYPSSEPSLSIKYARSLTSKSTMLRRKPDMSAEY